MKRALVILALAVLACHKTEKPAATGTHAATATAAKPAQPAPDPPNAPTNVGDPMPAYTAKTLDGAPFDIASQKGSVVHVNVWATCCNPCRFDTPELQKLYAANRTRGSNV